MVSKLAGDRGRLLLRSLMVSVVINLEFTAVYTLTCSICNDSLSKLFPCVLIKVLRIPLTFLICLSQTTPMWLSVGGFLVQLIQSTPCISQYSFVLLWFMSWKDFYNSLTASAKLLLLSDLICRMPPLLPINDCSVIKKETVSSEKVVSIWIAFLQGHVNMNPYRFNSFRFLQITNGPKKLTPQ